MYLIRPMTVNDAALSASNVSEPDAAVGETAWSSTSSYALAAQAIRTTTHRVYERVMATASATVTMTIASPCVVTWTGHTLTAGMPVAFSTTGALPTGLTPGTVYYVVSPAANTFEVAATPGGTPINTTGSQSGTHTAVAKNPDPATDTDQTYWLDAGPSNRWAMFDQKVGTQTQHAASIDVTINLSGVADSFALLNIEASSAQVIMTDSVDGLVYNQTFNLIDLSGITDPYSYTFDPIASVTSLVRNDMPKYGATASVRVVLTSAATAKCGACILGLSKDIGKVQYGAQVGIQDFSVKSTDDFGNYTIVERDFADTAQFDVWIEAVKVDQVKKLLASYRATPIVYVGSDVYESTTVLGFYKDFRTVISYPDFSVCTIELEGLT